MEKGNTKYEDGPTGPNGIYNIYHKKDGTVVLVLLHLKKMNIKLQYKYSKTGLHALLSNLKDISLTRNEVRVLWILVQKKWVNFSEIMKRLKLAKSTTAYILTSMVAKHLIRKKISPVSKKTVYLLNKKYPLYHAYMTYVIHYCLSELGVDLDEEV